MPTIRPVEAADIGAITAIYNTYVLHSTATFETEAVDEAEMRRRMEHITAAHPYLVCEEEAAGQRKVVGYCYAHEWKARTAYRHSLETTVYLHPAHLGQGLGRMLMERLIDACKDSNAHALIACITGGNAASEVLHRKLGFKKVSHFKQVGRKFGQWLDVTDYELTLPETPHKN